MAEGPATHSLCFDPDDHPDATFKAFEKFVKSYDLRYEAQYPDPPRTSLEVAIQRWKLNQDDEDPKPTMAQYDEICEDWKSKDKVKKLLGMFSSERFLADWMAAEPDEQARKGVTWETFQTKMKEFYKPTENSTLTNFHFRQLIQNKDETFTAFANRVEAEAKHCQLKCAAAACTAENTAIRDQIIIGTSNNAVKEEALLKSWDLATLRKEGMKMESAQKGGIELAGDNDLRRIGKYSNKNNKPQKTEWTCHFCGMITKNIKRHRAKECKARSNKCTLCNKVGHMPEKCPSKNKQVNQISTDTDSARNTETPTDKVGRIDVTDICPNIFRVSESTDGKEFKVQLMINNSLASVIADTGAKVSVCGEKEAKQWNLDKKIIKSNATIKPYKSPPLGLIGVARCAVSFGNRSIPVIWRVLPGSCETVLSGKACEDLGIIEFNKTPPPFQPIRLIHANNNPADKDMLQSALKDYPDNFNGLGKLKHHQVKLHVDPKIKPVALPPRTTPYHLEERVEKAIEKMIEDDVIEAQPQNEPAPWVSNSVIINKEDGDLRVTIDARQPNTALISTNHPIPKQEDIKAKLAGAEVFSKMDFKSSFWQLELHPDSRHLTVFHANNKLYRYKRLPMGLSPAQGELNTALKPVFDHIPSAHLIHDDLVIATKTMKEHEEAISMTMQAIARAGLTLNPNKCHFGLAEIEFWGMLFGKEGVKPDPKKVEALNHLTKPESREEVISFLCMMQSNASFIQDFAKKSAKLRELTKSSTKFHWDSKHDE